MNRRSLWIAGLAATIASAGYGQSIKKDCGEFRRDIHRGAACVEALFSQERYHFTMASLPPANGFAPGIVFTQHLSGTIGNPPQDNQVDISETGAVSTNGSTFEAGDLVWTLPFGSNDTSTSPQDLQSGSKKTWHDTALHVQAAHQAVHKLYFYGEGALSPDTQYVYAEDDIWGKATARVSLVGTPLSRNVVLTGETSLRATNLPPSGDAQAINKNLPVATLPGYLQQPLFAVNQLGVETRASKRVGGVLPEPLPNDPVLLFFSDWQFDNNASYKWFHNIDESGFSFQQFRFEGAERAFVKARVRRNYEPSEHRLLYNILCQGQSRVRANICNVLMLDVKSRLILSNMSAGNQIPFYLQPTLGGSDFDNNVTLRAWDHYRFRDRDAALVQVDMNALVWDPFGIYVFYDAGTVGNKPADLAFSHFRQDAGFGGTVRIQGNIVAETYLAWGRGRGPRWSFNFSKVF